MKKFILASIIATATIAQAQPCLNILNTRSTAINISRDANWDDTKISVNFGPKDGGSQLYKISPDQLITVCAFDPNQTTKNIGAQGLDLSDENGNFIAEFDFGNYDWDSYKTLPLVTITSVYPENSFNYEIKWQYQYIATLVIK